MRKTLLAALAALAGCFTPVAPVEPGAPDGSVILRCRVDADCPPARFDRCAPAEASCREGACVARSVPTLWQDDPGACAAAEDCACQRLGHADCEGGFDCVAGRCTWLCAQQACASDRDCPAGRVCEPGPGCTGESSCVEGCHANEDCPDGQLCSLLIDCFTCPCPGACEPAPGCRGDSDCPWQTVCEPTPELPEPHCIPGCRDDFDCTAGDACVLPDACPACADCPCVGTCRPRNGCSSDAECERGSICAEGPDCVTRCVPGCRTAADCAAGESCSPPPPCEGCGCDYGSCVAGQTGCTGDSDCGPAEVCEPISPECAGERACVPGCRADADCGEGASCLQPDCDGCPCPGFCVALPGCADDAECGPGRLCLGSPELGLDPLCIPGCRSDEGCSAGEACQPIDCDGLLCPPGLCTPAPALCASDEECGPGAVCEPGPGCEEPSRCVAGCHVDADCFGGRCLATPCQSCPCPGICEEPADCTDADRDGWVAGCQPGSCPNARGYCDCDDLDGGIHPGVPEFCGDGLDQNCDGAADEGCDCQSRPCAGALDCAPGTEYCEAGCCTACAMNPPPLCLQGECSFAGGVDALGCRQSPICAPCCGCPEVYDPVCGTNYATYPSPCDAACAGVEALHRGACLPGEGLGCGYPGSAVERCERGQYCRDTCPACDALMTRCTRVGACEEDFDCPAGLTPPACNAGPGRWQCLDHACVFRCP